MSKFEIAPKSTEVMLTWDDAVEYCKNLVVDDKSGWRLPTKDELDQMYKNRDSMPAGEEFDSIWHWSSLEDSATNAWNQRFSSGGQYSGNKMTSNCVRAVRNI